jgi:hypothetical protein
MATQRELTHKEITMINDLLDGQLTSENAKQAFLRIEQDPVLRSAYEKLRWTKSLLRQAPRRKVPHNFVLTRQMAQEATSFYKLRQQTFTIAGAMASFLFVLLLAVQLVPLGLETILPVAMKSEDMIMMEEAAAPEMLPAEPQEEVELFAMEAPMEESAEEEISEEQPPLSAAAEAEVVEEPSATLSPDEVSGGGGEPKPLVEEITDEANAVEESLPEADSVTEGRIAAEDAEDETLMDDPASISAIQEEEAVPQQSSADWIFLATVMAGLFAFVFIFISIRDKNRANPKK